MDGSTNEKLAMQRATDIADKLVPKYRSPPFSYYSCTGTIAQQWQAAWDGAIEALGYDSDRFKLPPTLFAEQ